MLPLWWLSRAPGRYAKQSSWKMLLHWNNRPQRCGFPMGERYEKMGMVVVNGLSRGNKDVFFWG